MTLPYELRSASAFDLAALKDLNIKFDFLPVVSVWHKGIRGGISYGLTPR